MLRGAVTIGVRSPYTIMTVPIPLHFATIGFAAVIALAGCESSNPSSLAASRGQTPLEAASRDIVTTLSQGFNAHTILQGIRRLRNT